MHYLTIKGEGQLELTMIILSFLTIVISLINNLSHAYYMKMFCWVIRYCDL